MAPACAPWQVLHVLTALVLNLQGLCLSSSSSSSSSTYAGRVLLPALADNLNSIMVKPFEVLRFSESWVELGFLDYSSNNELRQWIYNQVVAAGVGNRTLSSMDMIYVGLKDGRFIGSFSPTTTTERAAGQGLAADLSWAPYSIATVDASCVNSSSACRGEAGKVVLPSCQPGARVGTTCISQSTQNPVSVSNRSACAAAGGLWYAPCTATCCDTSIRNYYYTTVQARGQPLGFYRWRAYDHRVRGWYRGAVAAWQGSGTRLTWSEMYEFATSQALGLTAAIVATNGTSNELVGVFAIDYDVGSLSEIVKKSLSGGSASWAFIVERSTAKLVATSSAEQLYNRTAIIADGVSFLDSRLSATNSTHASIAAVAAMLVVEGWPSGVHAATEQFEFETSSVQSTYASVDWLVVAGMDIQCQSNEMWNALAGQCIVCPGGSQPGGANGSAHVLCEACPVGAAGTDGFCTLCGDGMEPNDDSTACVQCADGYAGTGGSCHPCDDGGQRSSVDRTLCICHEDRYDSWCSLSSARAAIVSGETCTTAALSQPDDPLHVFVWGSGRTWMIGESMESDNYNRGWSPSLVNPRCIECPFAGISCLFGVARPAAGFHEVPEASTATYDQHFFECDTPIFCLGVAQEGPSLSGIDDNGSSAVVEGTGTCMANHSGTFCGSCEEGFGMQDVEDACQPCGALEFGRLVVFLCCVVGVLYLCVSFSKFCLGKDLRHFVRCSFQPLRILISYGQVVGQLGSVLDFRFPGWFGKLVDVLRPLMEPWQIIVKMLQPADCLSIFGIGLGGFHPKWMMCVVVQPLLLCVLLLSMRLLTPRVDVKGGMFLILFICYPTINAVAMSSFICTSITGPVEGGAEESNVLDVDDRILCESSPHTGFQLVSLVVIATVGVAIPVGFGYTLWRKSRAHVEWRQELRIKDLAEELSVAIADVKNVAQQVQLAGYSFLMDAYRPSVIWWESLDMLRKLSYVGITLLFGRGSTAQLFVALGMSVVFSVLQIRCVPYKDEYDNYLKTSTELQIFVSIAITLTLKGGTQRQLEQEKITPDFYDMFLVLSFAVLVPVAMFVTIVLKVHSVQKVLDNPYEKDSRAELRKAFDLHLRGAATEKHRQHLESYLRGWKVKGQFAAFLSHYKDEAGPEARILKTRLVGAMPGVDPGAIFLDSDNLGDLAQLQQHVRDSDAVVLLLTKRFFQRPWCLVEMVTAVEEEKPLIVLRVVGPTCGDLAKMETTLCNLDEILAQHNPRAKAVLQEHLGLTPAEVGTMLKPRLTKASALQFAAQGGEAAIQTQVSLLAREIALLTEIGGNQIVAEMGRAAGSFPSEGKLGIPAGRYICVVNAAEVAHEVPRLQEWLVKRTDLTEGQILLSEEGDEDKTSVDHIRGDPIVECIRAGNCAAVLLLQTANVLKCPLCISRTYTALDLQVPLIPIHLQSTDPSLYPLLYHFEKAQVLMENLSVLSSVVVNQLKQQLLPASLKDVSRLLSRRVPLTISRPLVMMGRSATSNSSSSSAEYDTQLMGITRGLLNALEARKNNVGVLDKLSLVPEGRGGAVAGAANLSKGSQEDTVVAHNIRMPAPSRNPSLGPQMRSPTKLARASVSADSHNLAPGSTPFAGVSIYT